MLLCFRWLAGGNEGSLGWTVKDCERRDGGRWRKTMKPRLREKERTRESRNGGMPKMGRRFSPILETIRRRKLGLYIEPEQQTHGDLHHALVSLRSSAAPSPKPTKAHLGAKIQTPASWWMNNKAGIHLLNSSVESAVTKKVYIYLRDAQQTNSGVFCIRAGSETAVRGDTSFRISVRSCIPAKRRCRRIYGASGLTGSHRKRDEALKRRFDRSPPNHCDRKAGWICSEKQLS